MRKSAILLLAVAALAVCARAQEDDVDETHVVVLGDANFTDTIKKAKYALVEFYAPWCGHCKSLKPAYAAAATTLKSIDPEVVLAKVDATVEKKAAEDFEVRGFPTLKWFVDGEATEYTGGRSEQEIVSWIKKKTGPPTTPVASVADLDKVEDEVVVLGYFSAASGADFEALESFARKTEDAAFYTTTSKDVAAKFGIKSAPGYGIRRKYADQDEVFIAAEGNAHFKGDSFDEKLEAFMTAEKLPDYIEFSQANAKTIFQSGISEQIIIVGPSDLFKAGSALIKTIKEASAALRGKIVFVLSMTDNDNSGPIINYFGVDKDTKEAIVLGFDSAAGVKYTYNGGAITTAAITKFGEEVVAGTAPKFFKSAPIPEEPLDEGVTVVVGDTVESIVKDPTKDVLLEVYAPWCGHCKALAPTYSQLAKRFANIDSVVIAKLDGTANEHPDIEAQGYPTLLFFPAEKDAEPIPHKGGRDLLALTKFIKEHAKVAYELPKKAEKKDDKDDEYEHDEL